MATNLQIDDQLLAEAVKLGAFDFDPDYDYKAERRKSDKRIPKWES
jgi:hypothetical protein